MSRVFVRVLWLLLTMSHNEQAPKYKRQPSRTTETSLPHSAFARQTTKETHRDDDDYDDDDDDHIMHRSTALPTMAPHARQSLSVFVLRGSHRR